MDRLNAILIFILEKMGFSFNWIENSLEKNEPISHEVQYVFISFYLPFCSFTEHLWYGLCQIDPFGQIPRLKGTGS